MNQDDEDDDKTIPCLLERWLKDDQNPATTQATPEELDKIVEDTVEELHPQLTDLLYPFLKDKTGARLFHALRGLHIALGQQFGLVGEWMRDELRRNAPHISEEHVDHERDELLSAGAEHVQSHISFGLEDEDDGDDEEKLVH